MKGEHCDHIPQIGHSAKADKIYVIDKGRIVEEGTHFELIEQPTGLYRHLLSCSIYGQEMKKHMKGSDDVGIHVVCSFLPGLNMNHNINYIGDVSSKVSSTASDISCPFSTLNEPSTNT